MIMKDRLQPDGRKERKGMEPVSETWQQDEALGEALIAGLEAVGAEIFSSGNMDLDLTQTSYSTVPSVDLELGNQCSDYSDSTLDLLAEGIVNGIDDFFDQY